MELAEWIGRQRVFFCDRASSGAETIVHVRENGRRVIMFCAFEGSPIIVRLHGQGKIILPGELEYPALAGEFPNDIGTRAIIRMTVTRIANSFGMGVPVLKFEAARTDLDAWAEGKGVEKLAEYRRKKNEKSIDDLPAIDFA